MANNKLMTLTRRTQRYRKSRSGCLTCKVRKVKCDETHPACRRCTTTGRKCDGYAVAGHEQEVVGYLVIKHVPEQYLPADESRALSYFQHVTAPSLLNLDSASFWSSTILQICRHEQSLKHLIIAVSLADEQRSYAYLCNSLKRLSRLHHYGKALRLLSSQPNPEIWLIPMASLLLCVYEDLHSRGFSALQHIKSGRSILRTYGQAKLLEPIGRHPTASPILDQLVPIFSKLERQTWEFDPETLSPCSGLSLADLCPRDAFSVNMSSSTLFSWTIAFESLKHANEWLYALRPRCIASQAMVRPPTTRFHIVPAITYQLNMWLESLHVFVRLTSQSLSEQDLITISTLRTLQLCLHILSQTFPFHSEILFDEHSHVLEHIVQKLPFSFELTSIDVTPALWLGATKSRNPAYRRQAVCMLRRTDQKPGACAGRGQVLARAAEKIVEIEEEDLAMVLSCKDVPERKRIRIFGLEIVDERNELMVLFKRAPHNENARFDVVMVSLEGLNRSAGVDMKLEAVLSFDWMALEV